MFTPPIWDLKRQRSSKDGVVRIRVIYVMKRPLYTEANAQELRVAAIHGHTTTYATFFVCHFFFLVSLSIFYIQSNFHIKSYRNIVIVQASRLDCGILYVALGMDRTLLTLFVTKYAIPILFGIIALNWYMKTFQHTILYRPSIEIAVLDFQMESEN